MTVGPLYAWADGAFGTPFADHTWVTSYDAPYDSTPPTSRFWYCWGEPRAAGPGSSARLLVTTQADIAMAALIGPSDDQNGSYGMRYGIDGVCHQMANRVLFASVSADKPVVSTARCYRLSVMRYGHYGRNHEAWMATTSPLAKVISNGER
jgi:hypothetical protein